ncbi:hypothetical protein [Sphingomonas sp.]|uniref:hypothetical protein n=1 Tax=Sphingomonas sp. TaxID=28214 RepID=UPI003AFFE52B
MPRIFPLPTRLLRYSLAIVGPFGSAGAQFALSFVLLRHVAPSAFGRFSFLLVASQLSTGVWSALFCAPLPILLAGAGGDARAEPVRSVLTVSLVGAIVGFGVALAMALALGDGTTGALLFAGYAATNLLRWLARAHAYACGRPFRTTASDLAYALVLLAGTAVVALAGPTSAVPAYAALLAGTAAGLLPFGRTYLADQFLRASPRVARAYRPVWRDHARWSLFGVLTTEATANSHAYLVTLLLGPTAFAPVAASQLAIRPINVAVNALTEFERAQMAREIGAGRFDAALAAVRLFRWVLVATWSAIGLGIVLLLWRAPHALYPRSYDLHTLTIATALWMAVAIVRLARTPDNALMQAGGAFRPLAMASAWSSGVSVAAVLALILAGGPVLSILGILGGELLFALFIWRRSRRWLADARVTSPDPAAADAATIAESAPMLPIGADETIGRPPDLR